MDTVLLALRDGGDVDEGGLVLSGGAGRGGQGTIHRIVGRPGLLFKRYLQPAKVNGAALTDLVGLRHALPPAERERLDAQAAWPLCRVVDGSRCVGFLMREAPAAMRWQPASGSPKLTELQHLFRAERPATRGVLRPDPAERLALVLELAGLLDRLHRWGLVLGDLSGTNILWSVAPEPAVYLIDCDGARKAGALPVLDQADTPDWEDLRTPPGSRASTDSDRFKAALIIGRALAQDPYLTPDQQLDPLPGVLTERRLAAVRRTWAQAGGPYGSRPDLTAWLLALGGRDTIPLTRVVAPPPRPVDETMFDTRAPRGRIRLPPLRP
ncbi:hypothetical protein OG689_24230 [Kitasatospora sp. NBC_00240]|uniref:hypothetical protein n=1 Tax=Kitasatospora sp. NBC_00240 TaxID=2903567 RepID=UPI0022545BF1|nr:hypothetical protein [Kitasatospora sp. NBC_00240]MCX5212351.1 hypothetical protein [Kitasatospora sp. NBC_00240]